MKPLCDAVEKGTRLRTHRHKPSDELASEFERRRQSLHARRMVSTRHDSACVDPVRSAENGRRDALNERFQIDQRSRKVAAERPLRSLETPHGRWHNAGTATTRLGEWLRRFTLTDASSHISCQGLMMLGSIKLPFNGLCSRVQSRLMATREEAAGMSRHSKRNSPKPKRPKTRLGLPDLDQSESAVLDSLRSRESKRGYRHAMDEFIQWYCSEPRLSFNKIVVTRFRSFLENRNLAAGTINGRLAAVRRLAYEAADAGLLSPELAGGIRRVKGVKKLGVRLGNWLTAEEARHFWQSPHRTHSKESVIVPFSLCCLAADSDAAN